LLVYLAANPHWYNECRKEVDAAVAKFRTSPDERPSDILSRLTVDDWESEFKLLDLGLRETIRFTITGCGFRYNNSGKDVPIGQTGEVIPRDAFAVGLLVV
jgi:hypothetical protein